MVWQRVCNDELIPNAKSIIDSKLNDFYYAVQTDHRDRVGRWLRLSVVPLGLSG